MDPSKGKQSQKEAAMNIRKQAIRIAAINSVLIASLVGAVAARAGETIVTQVPFAFAMGDTVFPAGEYRFEVDRLSPNTVRVRSADSSTAAIALSSRANEIGTPLVRFNVYGEKRFLSRIRTSNGVAVTIRPGRQESLAAKEHDAPSVAEVGAIVQKGHS
jgi:D-aminopeptidase